MIPANPPSVVETGLTMGSAQAAQHTEVVSSTAPTRLGFGISARQEPKYGVSLSGRIVNRSTGIEIPDDEPVMIFRARDKHAAHAIAAYIAVCQNADHRAVVKSRLLDFEQFAAANRYCMKEPDSSLQDLAGANVGRTTSQAQEQQP